jgi:L-arabinose isomerase
VEDAARGFKLLSAQGESVAGEILRIGNTNSHYRFPLGAKGFVEAWNAQSPAHHCAVGVGHMAGKLNKLARLLDIPFVQVC